VREGRDGAAEMGTGTVDDEQSAPVKERRGSRGRPVSGEGVNREDEAEKEREGDRVIITVESFCRGIFQNDWAHCRNGGMPCSFAIRRGLRIARRCEGKRRERAKEEGRPVYPEERVEGERDLCFSYGGVRIGETYISRSYQ